MKRIVAIAAIGVAACFGNEQPPKNSPRIEASSGGLAAVEVEAVPTTPRVASDVDRSIVKLDETIEFRQQRFQTSRSWLDMETVSAARLARARLTADVADYVAAKNALSAAFDAAPEGSGPHLSRASYNVMVHEVGSVAADLDRFEARIFLKDSERAGALGLRGDVAFHHGDLIAALKNFREAEALDPTVASAGRLANYMLKTGRYDDAAELYATASSRVPASDPGLKAWAQLHRGIVELERGEIQKAAEFYASATATYTGWYLVEEHVAEAELLLGKTKAAIARYQRVLQRVPNGEFYAALGDAYIAADRPNEAEAEYQRAKASFERDLLRLPSAVSGHALDFYLSQRDPRALELATNNFQRRPGHEARTKLAQALLAGGQRSAAEETLKPTIATDWATVDFLSTAALVFAESNPDLSHEYRERADAVIAGSVADLAKTLGLQ